MGGKVKTEYSLRGASHGFLTSGAHTLVQEFTAQQPKLSHFPELFVSARHNVDAMPAGTTMSTRLLIAAVFISLAGLFALVGRWGANANVDVTATNVPAWELARSGTLEVPYLEGNTPWVVPDKDGRLVSNRSPGLIATALPSYAASQPDDFTNAPGTLTALALTLGSVWLIFRLLRRDFELPFALSATVVFALGTTTWTISAAQLWPHGPGQFWGALALTAAASRRHISTGLAFAGAILARPIMAVAAAVMGLRQSWQERDWRPATKIAAASMIGVALLVSYNRWLFGEWSVNGGQPSKLTVGAVERFDLSDYLINLYQMFIGWPNGFLLFTPVIGLAVLGAISAWGNIPNWAKSGATAGLIYLLVHAALNRASGGMPIFYRYPLEAITLAAPALAWGSHHLWKGRGLRRWLLIYSAAFSIVFMAIDVFFISCRTATPELLSCQLFG